MGCALLVVMPAPVDTVVLNVADVVVAALSVDVVFAFLVGAEFLASLPQAAAASATIATTGKVLE